jgi:hypothetical protein
MKPSASREFGRELLASKGKQTKINESKIAFNYLYLLAFIFPNPDFSIGYGRFKIKKSGRCLRLWTKCLQRWFPSLSPSRRAKRLDLVSKKIITQIPNFGKQNRIKKLALADCAAATPVSPAAGGEVCLRSPACLRLRRTDSRARPAASSESGAWRPGRRSLRRAEVPSLARTMTAPLCRKRASESFTHAT